MVMSGRHPFIAQPLTKEELRAMRANLRPGVILYHGVPIREVDAIDLVEVNGVWMTPEDRDAAQV